MPHALPCAVYRAHGKDTICRVLKKQRTVNIGHTAKTIFAVCLTLGTQQSCGNGLVACFVCRVPPVWHTANMSPVSIGRVPLRGTQQSIQIFLILPSQIFLFCAYNTCCFVLNFGIFLYSFTIFSEFVCLIKFLAIELEVFGVVDYNEPKNDIQVYEVNVRTYA